MGGAQRYPSMPLHGDGFRCALPILRKTHLHLPAARFARALPTVSPKQEGAGNAGCLLHPRSRVQEMVVEAHTSIQVQSEHSGIPCAVVLRLMARSPRRRIPHRRIDGFANPVGLAKTSTDLTPATGARTTRFCRPLQHRSSAAPPIAHRPKPALQSVSAQRALPRPPHSLPNVRDDRDTPLLAGQERARL
jgi:hypothetical protein